jgi:hypothetical protein
VEKTAETSLGRPGGARVRSLKQRKQTVRELQTQAVLHGDKTFLTFAAYVLAWLGRAVGIVWVCLFALVVLTKAGDGRVILGVAAIPVLLFWLVTRCLPRFAAWLTRNYP